MLHPVGDLPAGVYWRRRALVLGVVLSVAGGGTWLASSTTAAPSDGTQVAASTATVEATSGVPSLDQVVPSLAAVAVPTAVAAPTADTPADAAADDASPAAADAPAPADPAYTAGQACSDDMVAVDVVPEAPQVAAATKPTFTLVVTNTSPVPCTRSLDAGLREIVLLDAAGTRVWGSNDCFPEVSSDPRTLAVGEAVSFPLQWGGLTSVPGCTAPRTTPAPGSYTLQGRLDTAVGIPAPLVLV